MIASMRFVSSAVLLFVASTLVHSLVVPTRRTVYSELFMVRENRSPPHSRHQLHQLSSGIGPYIRNFSHSSVTQLSLFGRGKKDNDGENEKDKDGEKKVKQMKSSDTKRGKGELSSSSRGADEDSGDVGGLWIDIDPVAIVKSISWGSVLAGGAVGVLATLFVLIAVPVFELEQELLNGIDSNPAVSIFSRDSSIGEQQGSSGSDDVTAPVTLFKDILLDLENDYVDQIDPSKLFKTGVKAMLKSLDPYTEFEDLKAAKSMQESVSGKYGGVGLVIANNRDGAYKENPAPGTPSPSPPSVKSVEESKKETGTEILREEGRKSGKGVTVMDAFEGFAYDAGMRVGDRIIAVDGIDARELDADQVKDLLRGEPDTTLTVKYERDDVPVAVKVPAGSIINPVFSPSSPSSSSSLGSSGSSTSSGSKTSGGETAIVENNANLASRLAGMLREGTPRPVDLLKGREAILQRQLVKISDVRLATLLGDPSEGIGYINLSGFTAGSARDFRDALLLLRCNAPDDLKGLLLDLRGNPGGLLDQAVEIASYLVPEKSEIVSAKSKNGNEVVYRSSISPIRPENMKLAVLVNKGSASASEIVSGAIQDLDAGVIVGPSTTYGKGLVQKIIPLPYDAALKYTIARYYTPSGRCIQAVNYRGGRDSSSGISNNMNNNNNNNNNNEGSGGGEVLPRQEQLKQQELRNQVQPRNSGHHGGDSHADANSIHIDTNTAGKREMRAVFGTGLLAENGDSARSSATTGEDWKATEYFKFFRDTYFPPPSSSQSSSSPSFPSPLISQTHSTAKTTTRTRTRTVAAATAATTKTTTATSTTTTAREGARSAGLEAGATVAVGESEGEEGEEGEDAPVGRPLPDLDTDQGVEIPENERNTFLSLFEKRPLRDGGGIEPDVKVDPISIGPAESIFFSQGVYFNFANDYLQTHNVRSTLQQAAKAEKQARMKNPGFMQGAVGSSRQYFVLPPDYLFASSPSSSAVDKKEQQQQQQQREQQQRQQQSQKSMGQGGIDMEETDRIFRSSMFDLAQSLKNEPAGSSGTFSNARAIRIVPSDPDSVITIRVPNPSPNSAGNGRSGATVAKKSNDRQLGPVVGVNTKLRNSFFWGDLASSVPKNTDNIYRDFKRFVTEKSGKESAKRVNWEASLKPQIQKLEKSLRDSGLFSSSSTGSDKDTRAEYDSNDQNSRNNALIRELESLRPKIKEAALADMERNKKFIADGAEMAIMGRELPNRLMVYHTVIQDPQVASALTLLRGGTLNVVQTAVPSKYASSAEGATAISLTSISPATTTTPTAQSAESRIVGYNVVEVEAKRGGLVVNRERKGAATKDTVEVSYDMLLHPFSSSLSQQ